MARVRMVTRTVTITNYEVVTVNMETLKAEIFNVSIPSADCIPEKVRDKIIENGVPENCKVAMKTETGKTEKLYGMSEVDFLKYAQELPER